MNFFEFWCVRHLHFIVVNSTILITTIKWLHYLAVSCVYFWSASIERASGNRTPIRRRNPGNWIIIVCPFWNSCASDSDDWSGNNSRKSCAFPRTIDVAVERINIRTAENHSAAISDRSSKMGQFNRALFFRKHAKSTYANYST